MNNSFIEDEEKMCDFFSTKRKDFLKFYPHITEKEYNETIKNVLNLVDYWNKNHLIEYNLNDIDGNLLMQNIVSPIIFLKIFKIKK